MADGYVHGRRDREEKEEFNEEEIWTAMNDKMEGIPKSTKAKDSSSSSSSSACSTTPTRQSMMIPKSNNGFFAESVGGRVPFQQSAPINIPDWSKIYKKKKKGRSSELHHRDDNDDDDNDDDDNDDDDDDDDEEEEEEMIPPHEWIARKLARSQISPFSVFEGRGRTLKGRDLSKVRNAILTRTGFIE